MRFYDNILSTIGDSTLCFINGRTVVTPACDGRPVPSLASLRKLVNSVSVDFESGGASDLHSCINMIKQTLPQSRNSKLYILGQFLELDVTCLALHTLAEGINTFILFDCVTPMDRSCLETHRMRLTQAGAVPTTLSQVLGEWVYTETDETKIADLRQLTSQHYGLIQSTLT